MKISAILLFFICSLYASPMNAQANFRAGWEQANPLAPASPLELEEKVKTHQAFLDHATPQNDPLPRLYGFLYLFEDYLNAHDFSKAAEYLLEAETLAKDSNNSDWQGFVVFRRGVLNLRLKNYKQAITYYEKAAMLCTAAGDSLCMGESLGQIGSMYSQIGDYARAHQYFESALPLITRYGTNTRLAALLDNFGNLLSNQGRPAEAVPYFKKALMASEKAGDQRQTTIFQNNLAGAYCELRQYGQSLNLYRHCILLNKEKNWQEDLIYNYAGISGVFERTGRYREALDFFKKYQGLQDSLIGVSTQGKIAHLETQYYRQQQEIELQKSQAELATAHHSLERGILLLAALGLLVAVGLWRWRLQNRQARRDGLQNRENLAQLTRILLEKNELLAKLESQVAPLPPEGFEESLYDQRILTEADWVAFKGYFDKAHPGYLLRLRTAYPSLSDAEERLFLFIKLNLTRKEAAAILGISPDSVKKTRQRLRQRLGLGEEVELEVYVRGF